MNEELLQQILNELKEMKQEQQKINLRLNTIETDIKELKTGQQEIKNILTIQVPIHMKLMKNICTNKIRKFTI